MPNYYNTWDIEELHDTLRAIPTLHSLLPEIAYVETFVDCVNRSSDGWASWATAWRAGSALLTLIEEATRTNVLPPPAKITAARSRIKAVVTRHHLTMKV